MAQRLVAGKPRSDPIDHRAKLGPPPIRVYAVSSGDRGNFRCLHKPRTMPRSPPLPAQTRHTTKITIYGCSTSRRPDDHQLETSTRPTRDRLPRPHQPLPIGPSETLTYTNNLTSSRCDTTTRLLTSPLSPRRPRSDLWMAFGPGLLLTLEVDATPNALDPHQRHRPIPGPSGPPVVQPRLRPAHRAPTRRRRCFDRVLDLAVTIRDRQHGHACQPEHRRGTTVLNHLGPFSSCSVTPRIKRPQGHSQAQATNRVTRPLPRFITKSPNSELFHPQLSSSY